MNDKYTGWTQLVLAAVAAFAQVWSIIHGAPVDVGHAGLIAGIAASGANHISK